MPAIDDRPRDRPADHVPGDAVDALLVFADPVVFPPVAPYGLQAVGAALRAAGVTFRIVLPFMAERPAELVRAAIAESRPRIIGFSFRNLDEAGFGPASRGEVTFIGALKELVAAAGESGAVRAIGGSGFSIAPRELLTEAGAEIGFVGAAEHDFARFCARILREDQDVAGAAKDLASALLPGGRLPRPPLVRLGVAGDAPEAALELIRIGGGTVPVRTKSGCSLRCSYCVVPSIEALNLRPWKDIERELQRLVERGLGDRIFIADGEFNLPDLERAKYLCRQMQARFGGALKWRCYVDAYAVDRELVDDMMAAGCIGVSLTADSYSVEGRRGHTKGSGVGKVRDATELLLNSDLAVIINLLLGGPRETASSLDETVDRALGYHARGAALAITFGLRVYPGTPLAKMVTLPAFSPHYTPLPNYPWLGVFCSPWPAPQLADHVMRRLPKSDRIHFTNTLSARDQDYYRRLALATGKLSERQSQAAFDQFRVLCEEFPRRKEGWLGLLRAQQSLRQTHGKPAC